MQVNVLENMNSLLVKIDNVVPIVMISHKHLKLPELNY